MAKKKIWFIGKPVIPLDNQLFITGIAFHFTGSFLLSELIISEMKVTLTTKVTVVKSIGANTLNAVASKGCIVSFKSSSIYSADQFNN